MLTNEEIQTLIEKAKKARENAFVPRSGHKIGSCVLTTDGEYFEGCNVEAIISGLGNCAERAAIDHAIVHGKYEFKAICTVDAKHTYPCGVCSQYLLQFFQLTQKEITVVTSDTNGSYKINDLKDLLPHGYLTGSNLDKIRSYKNK